MDKNCNESTAEMFFPESNDIVGIAAAKKICSMCNFKQSCFMLAFKTPGGEYGIWGGTTEEERKLIRSFNIQPNETLRQKLETTTQRLAVA